MRSETYIMAALVLAGCGPRDGAPKTSEVGVKTDSVTAESETVPVGRGEVAYVSNEGSETLSIVDLTKDTVIADIYVGKRPRGVRVSQDGRTVYVALTGSPRCPPSMPDEECEKMKSDRSKDGIAEVDVVARKLVRILPSGSDPETFDITTDGKRLFVSNEDAGTASMIDIATGKVAAALPVGREPEGVRAAPDGKTVWVTGETDHDVTVLDAVTGKKVGHIEVGKRPRDVVFMPGGKKAYVTAEVDGTVTDVDIAAGKVVKTIPMGEGAKPMSLVTTRDGSRVFVSTGRGGVVKVIDPATDSIVGSVKVGARPWGLALSGDERRLYTANGSSNDISVVDVQSLQVIKTIPVGKLPWGVIVAPAPSSAPPTS